MSSAAFTPGPWTRIIGLEGNGEELSQEEQLVNAKGVAVVLLSHDGSDEGDANIALIAAAPDLYEALKLSLPLLATMERREESNVILEVYERAYTALKKATAQPDSLSPHAEVK